MISGNKHTFIDATLFMGMHAADSAIRDFSLWVMSHHFTGRIYMSLEQIGLCDDVVWSYPRAVQDSYYPFMDCLHSEMDIKRIPYSFSDIQLATDFLKDTSATLSPSQALVLAQVVNHDGILFTHDNDVASKAASLERLGEAPVDSSSETPSYYIRPGNELFSRDLDCLYKRSACLVYD